jgi:pimeloyl-ACP methyl ester carboxylesterase
MHNVRLMIDKGSALQLNSQFAQDRLNACDVLYVHGATFPIASSIFFEFDGRSWAHALADAGFNAWGFDFLGYGGSDRYREDDPHPILGRIPQAAPQLAHVIRHIHERNGGKPISLLAHSWGTLVALEVAGKFPELVDRIVLFGPIAPRHDTTEEVSLNKLPSTHLLSVWAQYRNFIAEVPRDEPQVLLDRHFEQWAEIYLASDVESSTRSPRAVRAPFGPVADLLETWCGAELVDASRVVSPTLVVRGEWDSACTDDDARFLLGKLAARVNRDVKLKCGTHRMHLEEGRTALYDAVNHFLGESLT